MSERVDQRPILVKQKGLSRNEECLKNLQYKCACYLSDEEKRKPALKALRDEVGAYSLFNLLDEGVTEAYDQGCRQLCEGKIPTILEKLNAFFSKNTFPK